MYAKRDQILFAKDISELLLETFSDCGVALCKRSIPEGAQTQVVNGDNLAALIAPRFLPEGVIKPSLYDEADPKEAGEDLGEINPLQDYVNEGWDMFREMLETISLEVVLNLMNVKVETKKEEPKEAFTVQANVVEEKPAQEEKKEEMKVAIDKETEAKASLNITEIDKNKKAAEEHDFEDVHTN